MKIEDRVYGKVEINEPVILELINSKSFQRIKKVSQFGIPDKYFIKKNFSRFEHCVGVMILLQKLKAPLEEQIAGLLHDVSHPSFSHVVDWTFGAGSQGNEDYQDEQHEEFIQSSEIPEILEKYNFSLERILSEENFPLLEKDIPDICADRFDYALREIVIDGKSELAKELFQSVENVDNTFVFKSKKDAQTFAETFLNLHINDWGSATSVILYDLFSKAFKIAVNEGLIKHEDFWNLEEDILMKRLEKSGNKEILNILKKMETRDFEDKSGRTVWRKFRYVDPYFVQEKRILRLSEVDSDFLSRIENERERTKEGILV